MPKKLFYREFYTKEHKFFPETSHGYLLIRTNEYQISIHNWNGFEYPEYFESNLEHGSRFIILSKISGGSLEILNDYCKDNYINILLKTKDRNRIIRQLEINEINSFVNEYDCSMSSVHERNNHFFIN